MRVTWMNPGGSSPRRRSTAPTSTSRACGRRSLKPGLTASLHSGRKKAHRLGGTRPLEICHSKEQETDMAAAQPITPCLWFDSQAEEAARFYTGIFKNSKLGAISRYNEAGRAVHGQPAGKVMTVAFELNGQPFTALNGGPAFKINGGDSFHDLIPAP